jgi:hypothetical protein
MSGHHCLKAANETTGNLGHGVVIHNRAQKVRARIPLLPLVDARVLLVLLSAAGRPGRDERHRFPVLRQLNAPIDRDLTAAASLLLDRVRVNAAERQFPRIGALSLMKSVEGNGDFRWCRDRSQRQVCSKPPGWPLTTISLSGGALRVIEDFASWAPDASHAFWAMPPVRHRERNKTTKLYGHRVTSCENSEMRAGTVASPQYEGQALTLAIRRCNSMRSE